MRLLSVTLALCALTACYDFTGSREKLGFATDATLDGFHPWTPEHGLANGARPLLKVTEILSTEKAPDQVTFDGSDLEIAPEEHGAYLSGRGRAWVHAEADGIRDDFRLRWTRPERLHVLTATSVLVGDPAPAQSLLIVKGETVPLALGLTDRRGRPLGWVADQMRVSSPTLETGLSSHLQIRAANLGVTELTVSWHGLAQTLSVEVISAEDVDFIEVREIDDDDGDCVVLATGVSEDREVTGLSSLVWSHTPETGPLVPCAEGPTRAHLDGRPLPMRRDD